MTTSVLIADDHPIFRRGLREVIEAHPGFSVVAEAENGVEALRLMRAQQPTLALVDIAMPEADGFDVIAQARRWPDAPAFTVLTMYDEYAYFARAFSLGAVGYLLKEHAEDEVLRCLQATAAGRRYVGRGIGWDPDAAAGDEGSRVLAGLSAAERRILKLVGEGHSSREIADILCISPRTVENHRAHMTAKLSLHGAHALLRFALVHREEL